MEFHELKKRRQILKLNEEFFFDFFLAATKDVVLKPHITVPKGCILLGVHHDYFNRVFGFVIAHESFSEVPDGEIPPIYNLNGTPFYSIAKDNSEDSNVTVLIAE